MNPEEVVAYLRVSKGDGSMTVENQRLPLEQWATARGAKIVEWIEEKESTKKRRPEKDQLLRRVTRGEVPHVAFLRLDRWARSLQELVPDLDQMTRAGAQITSLRDLGPLDPRSPTGRLQIHVLGAVAEFERDLIRQRTLEGLARARSQGRFGGRPRKIA